MNKGSPSNHACSEKFGKNWIVALQWAVLSSRMFIPIQEKTVDIRFYHCTLTRGEPRAIECDALEWITKDQVADYSFPEADVALLEHLDRCPSSNGYESYQFCLSIDRWISHA